MTLFCCIGTTNSIGVRRANVREIYMRLSQRSIVPPGHNAVSSVSVSPLKGTLRERGMEGFVFGDAFGFVFNSNLANLSGLSERRIVVITSRSQQVSCHATFDSRSLTLPDVATFRILQEAATGFRSILNQMGINQQHLRSLLNAAERQVQISYHNNVTANLNGSSSYLNTRSNTPPAIARLGTPMLRVLNTLRFFATLNKYLTPTPERVVHIGKIIR